MAGSCHGPFAVMVLTFSWRYYEKPRQRHTIAYLSVDDLPNRQLLTPLVSVMITFIHTRLLFSYGKGTWRLSFWHSSHWGNSYFKNVLQRPILFRAFVLFVFSFMQEQRPFLRSRPFILLNEQVVSHLKWHCRSTDLASLYKSRIYSNYKMSVNISTKIIWIFPSIATVSTDYSIIKYFYLLMEYEISVSLGIFLRSSRQIRNL